MIFCPVGFALFLLKRNGVSFPLAGSFRILASHHFAPDEDGKSRRAVQVMRSAANKG
jgi:hypothetical protein